MIQWREKTSIRCTVALRRSNQNCHHLALVIRAHPAKSSKPTYLKNRTLSNNVATWVYTCIYLRFIVNCLLISKDPQKNHHIQNCEAAVHFAHLGFPWLPAASKVRSRTWTWLLWGVENSWCQPPKNIWKSLGLTSSCQEKKVYVCTCVYTHIYTHDIYTHIYIYNMCIYIYIHICVWLPVWNYIYIIYT
jgi:hypothetical protein